MSIPEEVNALFKQDSVSKSIRIHFPNGERPDIVNDNIESESVQINQNICSQDKLKFGLCEASRFECTVHDIEKKYIVDENEQYVRNPNPLRGNIKGCKIEVFLEVDISSLTDAEIAEYGQTAEDVPYPFYRIPRGEYTVESCRKQSNMDKRTITAYDSMQSDNIDVPLKYWLQQTQLPLVVRDDMPVAMQCKNLYDNMVSLCAYNNIKMSDQMVRLDDGTLTCADEDITTEQVFGNVFYKINGIFVNNITESTRVVIVNKDVTEKEYGVNPLLEMSLYGGNMDTSHISCDGKMIVTVDYDMDCVAAYNKKMNELQGTQMTVAERLREIKKDIYVAVPYTYTASDGNGSGSCCIRPFTVIDCHTLGIDEGDTEYNAVVDGKINLCGRLLIVRRPERYEGSRPYVIMDAYNVIKSASVYRVEPDSAFVNADLDFNVKYSEGEDGSNIEVDNTSVRDLLGSYLEINGVFGTIDSDGYLRPKTLIGNAHWMLSANWMLSDKWLLNYSQDNRIPSGEEITVYYDEDYKCELYGRIRVLGDNNTVSMSYIGNKEGGACYDISNNLLLNNGIYSYDDMVKMLKAMFERICSVRFMPMYIETPYQPNRQLGDKIIINDDGKEIGTYIFCVNTSGISSMVDEIDTENIK